MNLNRCLMSFLIVATLVFSFSLIIPGAPANAGGGGAYISLHTFNLVCQSGGTQISHLVRVDMFIPAGYYRDFTNSEGVTLSTPPSGSDTTLTDVIWNSFTSASPYNEQSYIYDTSDAKVYEAGYEADCTGVADGDPAVMTSWSRPIGTATGNTPAANSEPVPGPDMVAIPDYAVVGAFTQSTVFYYAPRMDAASDVAIEAGTTLWVFGLDESGQFYQVLLSGKFFWVPVGTIGPNYDDVWNGAPLPANVVN
ncbi:MAG: hypothetical protein JXQ72_06735 [Anaerolineae bacterium]|nr:hypothetical protein [Anaerolineae bacterium]